MRRAILDSDSNPPRHEQIAARLFKHAVPGAALGLVPFIVTSTVIVGLVRGGVDPHFSRHCKTEYDVARGTINLIKQFMGSYLQPDMLQDALSALAERPLTVLAGGTDFYPAHVGKPVSVDILDVTHLSTLREITEAPDYWRIGATATWTDVIQVPLPNYFCGLKLAAREIGGVQIQNAGTIVGNICNASPAADGVPALLALDAQVELASLNITRRLPLVDFILGNRKTCRASNELVTAIVIPKWQLSARSTFSKIGARKYLLISIAMVSVCLETNADNIITRVGIAVGACSAVAQRLTSLEHKFIGRPRAAAMADLAETGDLANLTPIDDVRASKEYRLDAALTLVKRALRELANE